MFIHIYFDLGNDKKWLHHVFNTRIYMCPYTNTLIMCNKTNFTTVQHTDLQTCTTSAGSDIGLVWYIILENQLQSYGRKKDQI